MTMLLVCTVMLVLFDIRQLEKCPDQWAVLGQGCEERSREEARTPWILWRERMITVTLGVNVEGIPLNDIMLLGGRVDADMTM